MKAAISFCSVLLWSARATENPLIIDGFAWAENLAFDGLGGLFVSEAVSGELWRVSACGTFEINKVYIFCS